MRIVRKWSLLPLTVFLSGCLLTLFFTNCQKQTQDSLNLSSTSSPSTTTSANQNVMADPFAESKVQINLALMNEANPSLQKSTSGAEVPAGTKLIAIASNECMAEKAGELSEQVYNYDQEFANLDVQAYTWTTDRDLTLSELQTLADQDPCVKGLANDGIARATGLNDPLLSRETQFLSIGGPETYSFFSDKSHGSIKPVVVAIIDSGITPTHPELANQLWHNSANEIGKNYISSGDPIDDYGHGTNVSGIIAAESNNGVGIVGVMGHNIQLMSLKVQDNTGVGSISNITNAINFARSNGADVINISMVGYGANAALQSALQSAANDSNIFIAVAAGNNAITISPNTSDTYAVPALYGSAINGMMTVGSVVSNTNARSSFSNVSTTYVEVAAPGSSGMYFTAMPATYESKEGTSYSSPQVAAAAALTISFLRQHNVSYTAATIESILAATAYRSASASSYFAQGRVLDLRGLKEYLQLTYIGAQSGGFSDF